MIRSFSLAALGWLAANVAVFAQTDAPAGPDVTTVLFTGTSPYHNIRVEDHNGLRTLYFDDTRESRMEVANPNAGQFEYTEYFQMPWLWNADIKNILIMGLGGASTQKAMAHYHPGVTVQSVDIDPMVADVAKKYFSYQLSDRQKVTILDGRMFLRRSQEKYDLIVMDAYTQGRYGASLPPHLVTKEFFQIARDHLTPNGLVAYNVITVLRDFHTDILGAMYRTLKEVFPQVYLFQAKTSLNVILIATMSKQPLDAAALRKTAATLVDSKRLTFPNFVERVNNFQPKPPPDYEKCPILTDDFAPVEGLTGAGAAQPTPKP